MTTPPNTQETKANKNRNTNKKFLKWFGLGVGIIVLLIIIAAIATGGDESTDTQDETAVEATPADPLEAIADATDEEATAEMSGINLEVSFPLSTSTTQDFLRVGAQERTTNALEAIQQHGSDLDYERVIIRGNQDDREIMSPVYLPEDVEAIDFDTFQSTDVWDIRDGGVVHPDLTDD